MWRRMKSKYLLDLTLSHVVNLFECKSMSTQSNYPFKSQTTSTWFYFSLKCLETRLAHYSLWIHKTQSQPTQKPAQNIHSIVHNSPNWKHLKRPSNDEWINKSGITTQRNIIWQWKEVRTDTCCDMDKLWKHRVKWKKPDTEDHRWWGAISITPSIGSLQGWDVDEPLWGWRGGVLWEIGREKVDKYAGVQFLLG